MSSPGTEPAVGRQTRLVLITLASGQFLMKLDSSVMNVAIATVAKDVRTTVTGIQPAITLYKLVMAMLMIPGGKVGSLIGRKRAFSIGCVISPWSDCSSRPGSPWSSRGASGEDRPDREPRREPTR